MHQENSWYSYSILREKRVKCFFFFFLHKPSHFACYSSQMMNPYIFRTFSLKRHQTLLGLSLVLILNGFRMQAECFFFHFMFCHCGICKKPEFLLSLTVSFNGIFVFKQIVKDKKFLFILKCYYFLLNGHKNVKVTWMKKQQNRFNQLAYYNKLCPSKITQK